MDALTSLDLHYLVREFSELIGARVDKIFQIETGRKDFFFSFHKASVGKFLLRISLPDKIYLTKKKHIFPETPPPYCVFLRKYLTNTRITKIIQHEFERIIEITFSGKENSYILVVELFSKGNMVLCDESMKIKSPLENQSWRDRTIRGGILYQYPPKQANTKEISEKDFKEMVEKSDRQIVKLLATALGLGGRYAEEICSVSEVDKNSVASSSEQISALYQTVREIFSRQGRPCVVGGRAFPFVLKSLNPAEISFSDSFSSAIDSVVESSKPQESFAEVDKEKKICASQEEKLSEFLTKAESYQKCGELLYQDYTDVKFLLGEIKKLKRQGSSWPQIKAELKKHPLFVSLDETNRELIINIDEK